MKKFLLCTVLILILCQCQRIAEDQNIFRVYLDDCKTMIDLKLSNLMDSCRLVQLETTNESILDEINFIYITNKMIIVCDGNGVYKFSGDGKFIKKLIQTGRGPDEISSQCIYNYYEAQDILFIINRMSHDENILRYDVKSERFQSPVKKCFPVSWGDFIVYDDSLIMGSIEMGGFLPAHDSHPVPYAMFIQNFNGEFISGIKSTKRLVQEDFNGLFQRMSIHTGDEYIHLKNSHDDTIFNFRNNKITPYLIPVFKNSQNIPKLLPDVGTRNLSWGKYENSSFLIFNLAEFEGWKDIKGFSSAVYNYKFYFLNKSSGKYAQIRFFNDDLTGTETEIEKTMHSIPGAPNSLPNGKLYRIYLPNELLNPGNKHDNAFPEDLLSDYDLIKSRIKETDNPVLLIGKPKNKLHILE